MHHQIADLVSAEEQLIEALPEMAKAATDKDLKKAFQDHLKETKNQLKRLEEVKKVVKLLQETLDEEGNADKLLTKIAEGAVNQHAIDEQMAASTKK